TILYNDTFRGIVRAVKLTASGTVQSIEDFTTGATLVVKMKRAADGLIYFVDLDDGTVGRWVAN
ncbi:MAG: hypothetical protein AB7I30_12765, partial [Isosphaeraceae bacterium]